MRYLVTGSEMKEYDTNTIETFGIPSLVLMERAALAVYAELKKICQKTDPILIVCGTGNNGADGLAVARLLFLEHYQVKAVLIGDPGRMSAQCRKQYEILQAYGYVVEDALPDGDQSFVIVDAIFGVGLSRKLEGIYADTVDRMNHMHGKKVAVDVPSGLSSDTGAILGTAFHADLTVTFGFEKLGLYLWPGNEYSGRVICAPVGITEESFCGNPPGVQVLDDTDLALLPRRKSHSNKGSYGRLLVIAGCGNMAGAAILSARAAYVTGCGLVKVYTEASNRLALYNGVPEAILSTYPEADWKDKMLSEDLTWADAIVCGPGIGQSETAHMIVKEVLMQAKVPLLLDADALNILAEDPSLFHRIPENTIVTPHLGEMGRVTKQPVSAIQKDLIHTAGTFSDTHRAVCVLKDEHTVIRDPDGTCFLNLTGNNGMATAGSGDVLTGIIGSLLAQGMSQTDAAACGVYLHGKAGDTIRSETGSHSMMASDLIEGLKKYLVKKHL